MKDSRRTQRVGFACQVEFTVAGQQHACELLDISLRGALIGRFNDEPPPLGADCRLLLTLDENQEVSIVMSGEVAHYEDNRVGMHCKSIDIDSMTHLRRLVSLNLGDPDLLERDLESLWHAH